LFPLAKVIPLGWSARTDRCGQRAAALHNITRPEGLTLSLHGGAGRAHKRQARRPAADIREVRQQAMSAPTMSSRRLVDIEDLICPGCEEPVHRCPPAGLAADDGVVPEFSHTDGSALCSGSEPVEAPSWRGESRTGE
jgi:hypothetical protein